MRDIVVIAHDMRSTHNVGSLLRTAEGLGVTKLYLTGYTPYPARDADDRLPHISAKLHQQIKKTALGAEQLVNWEYCSDIAQVLKKLTAEGYSLAALEQSSEAVPLHKYDAPDKIALLLGTEVTGIPSGLLESISTHLVIPMFGKKESFNVVQAAAMAVFDLRFR